MTPEIKLKHRYNITTMLNKHISVKYKRKKDMTHQLSGKVIKVRKASFILLINDELKISIGIRNLINEPKLI